MTRNKEGTVAHCISIDSVVVTSTKPRRVRAIIIIISPLTAERWHQGIVHDIDAQCIY
jgi:hypothetical protein